MYLGCGLTKASITEQRTTLFYFEAYELEFDFVDDDVGIWKSYSCVPDWKTDVEIPRERTLAGFDADVVEFVCGNSPEDSLASCCNEIAVNKQRETENYESLFRRLKSFPSLDLMTCHTCLKFVSSILGAHDTASGCTLRSGHGAVTIVRLILVNDGLAANKAVPLNPFSTDILTAALCARVFVLHSNCFRRNCMPWTEHTVGWRKNPRSVFVGPVQARLDPAQHLDSGNDKSFLRGSEQVK